MSTQIITWQIVFALLFYVNSIQSYACDFPPKELLGKPRMEYQGIYENHAYKYSVRIPDTFTGYDQPTPPHHGFGIVIGEGRQSYISVNGEANSLGYDTSRDAAKRLVEYLRQDGKRVESVSIIDSHLGPLEASDLLVKYTCQTSTEQHVCSSLVALSPDKDVLYVITLYAPVSRYSNDRAVLDNLAASWKYMGENKSP